MKIVERHFSVQMSPTTIELSSLLLRKSFEHDPKKRSRILSPSI